MSCGLTFLRKGSEVSGGRSEGQRGPKGQVIEGLRGYHPSTVSTGRSWLMSPGADGRAWGGHTEPAWKPLQDPRRLGVGDSQKRGDRWLLLGLL